MTQANISKVNPNHYLGCHPLNPNDQLNNYFDDHNLDDQIPFKRFTPESILNGVITWKRQRTLRRKTLDSVLEKVFTSDVPCKGHAAKYLRHMYRRNCKPNTIRGAYTAILLFLLFLKQSGKTHFGQITRIDLEAFVEKEQDRDLKISTVRTRLQALYAFFRYLVKEQAVHTDLLERKIKLKLPQSLPRAMASYDEIKLLSVINNTRNRALILMLLRTGMRIGELLNTRVNDVDLKERTIKIYEGEKNFIGRVVYFSDDARDALKAWLKKRNSRMSFLFYGQKGNSLCYSAARVMFKKYLQKAELSLKGYTVHCLRHTFATDLLNAGMRLECLQQLLGHSKLDVTRIYARLTDKTREQEYFKAMLKIERGEY
jgi:site-specific recombinase XerD